MNTIHPLTTPWVCFPKSLSPLNFRWENLGWWNIQFDRHKNTYMVDNLLEVYLLDFGRCKYKPLRQSWKWAAEKNLQSYIFARYSGFNKWIQSPVDLHSRPNVSTLQSSVFIRGDLKFQLTMWLLYIHGMTSSGNKMDIFLWQISTVIPIRSLITHIL